MPPSQLNPDITPKLDEITLKALEKDRDIRYQHASDLRADLKRLKRDTESGHSAASALPATPAVAVRTIRNWPTQRQWLIGLGGAAVIAIGFFTYWLTRPLPAPRLTGSVQITKDGLVKYPPVLTDGSRLFFMAGAGERVAPYQVGIAHKPANCREPMLTLCRNAPVSALCNP